MDSFQIVPSPPRPVSLRLVPVFLPHAGCPGRCLFCHQRVQTGQPQLPLAQLEACVDAALDGVQGPVGLGFFGGTFTALPKGVQQRLVDRARRYLEDCGGLVHVRVSTRPDALTADALWWLRRLGVHMVELGIQTFAGQVLVQCGRPMSPAQLRRACALVQEAGLELGIQLLPGLPGHRMDDWQEDVAQTLEMQPQVVRVYPCLVLAGSALARLWQQGRFVPWELEATIGCLADALPRFWRQGIRVVRLGLAPQPGMKVLAGPWHPALGNMARGVALARLVMRAAQGEPLAGMEAPRWVQGDLWGYQGRLRPLWRQLGIGDGNLAWKETENIRLWKRASTSIQ